MKPMPCPACLPCVFAVIAPGSGEDGVSFSNPWISCEALFESGEIGATCLWPHVCNCRRPLCATGGLKPACPKPANFDQRALALGGLNCRRLIAVACSATTTLQLRPDPGHRAFCDDISPTSNYEQTSFCNVSDALSVGNQMTSLTTFSGGAGSIHPP